MGRGASAVEATEAAVLRLRKFQPQDNAATEAREGLETAYSYLGQARDLDFASRGKYSDIPHTPWSEALCEVFDAASMLQLAAQYTLGNKAVGVRSSSQTTARNALRAAIDHTQRTQEYLGKVKKRLAPIEATEAAVQGLDDLSSGIEGVSRVLRSCPSDQLPNCSSTEKALLEPLQKIQDGQDILNVTIARSELLGDTKETRTAYAKAAEFTAYGVMHASRLLLDGTQYFIIQS